MKCPLCDFKAARGHASKSNERWTIFRHLVTTDQEHMKFAGELADFMDKDADRVIGAVSNLRKTNNWSNI